METVENPFIVSGSIDPEYFCDRRDESARLIKSLTNGNNVVLMSPRRMGKTGLIQFCYGKSSSSTSSTLPDLKNSHTFWERKSSTAWHPRTAG